MALPSPVPGLVLNYSYLWSHQSAAGQEEGVKDRPCVVVLAVRLREDGRQTVAVAPVTHTPPSRPDEAVEIPPATKRRLQLDDQRSWIVTTEVNSFIWPGPDLRPVSRHRPGVYAYGVIPLDLFQAVRAQFLTRAPQLVRRD